MGAFLFKNSNNTDIHKVKNKSAPHCPHPVLSINNIAFPDLCFRGEGELISWCVRAADCHPAVFGPREAAGPWWSWEEGLVAVVVVVVVVVFCFCLVRL